MNIFLWVLQGLLALHTIAGGLWKMSHSAMDTMPSLMVIPESVWLGMGGIELLAGFGLIIPLFYKPLRIVTPIAAAYIVAEMLVISGLHLFSGAANFGPMVYWLVVAAVCAFIAYGRLVLKPI